MFSQVSVCPQGGSRSLSRGVSVQGGLRPGGLCKGVSVQGGSLSREGCLCLGRWVSVQGGGFCPGRSLSRGSLSRGSLSSGELCHRDRPYGNERAIRIQLECILVYLFSTEVEDPLPSPNPLLPPERLTDLHADFITTKIVTARISMATTLK